MDPSLFDGPISGPEVLRALHAAGRLSVLACTFNQQGRGPPPAAQLAAQLLHPGGAARRRRRHHVYAFGSEECGAGIARSLVALSPPAERWAAALGAALGPDYVLVAQAALASLHLIVFAHAALAPVVGDVQTGSVATGFGNAVGNKGGVGVAFNVGKTALLFVNCHLAAHARFVSRRNADLLRIEEAMPLAPGGFGIEARLTLERRLHRVPRSLPPQQQQRKQMQKQPAQSGGGGRSGGGGISDGGGGSNGSGVSGGGSSGGGSSGGGSGGSGSGSGSGSGGGGDGSSNSSSSSSSSGGGGGGGDGDDDDDDDDDDNDNDGDDDSGEVEGGGGGGASASPAPTPRGVLAALFSRAKDPLPLRVSDRYDRVVWMGDLNYRLDLSRDAVDAALASGESAALAPLLAADQLGAERVAGRIFEGFSEGQISFRPTYKFDADSDVYDSGPKRRVPSWTDRILYKSRAERAEGAAAAVSGGSGGSGGGGGGGELMLPTFYGSVEGIRSSDHRPVVAEFSVALRGAAVAAPPVLRPVFEAVSTAIATLAAAGSPRPAAPRSQQRGKSASIVPVELDASGRVVASERAASPRSSACVVS